MSGDDMKVAHNNVISDFCGGSMMQNRPQIDKLFFEDSLATKKHGFLFFHELIGI